MFTSRVYGGPLRTASVRGMGQANASPYSMFAPAKPQTVITWKEGGVTPTRGRQSECKASQLANGGV